MAEEYDLCPDCQKPLDDVNATVGVDLQGGVVNGKLTAKVTGEDMQGCWCGRCGHIIKVNEWDYESQRKEVRLGL